MRQTETISPQLNRIQMLALIVGVVGAVLAVIGAFINPEQFFYSYLFGYVFWISLALGCFAIMMIHHLVGGTWGFVIRRFLESGAMTLLLMAVLFIPIIFGLRQLYLWARPEEVAEIALLQHKAPYLNVPFFLGRAVLYFVIWIGLAYLFNRWSAEQDRTGDPRLAGRMYTFSAVGLILYTLTATFAAYDWMMSLEPEWFSSIYGVIFMAGQALVTIAFVIILARWLEKREPLSQWLSIPVFNDLGNFLMAFIAFWAYVSFSQYLIIYQSNLPEAVTWYITRSQGGWQWVALILIFFHFALPFVVLLARRIKRNERILTAVAIYMMVMHAVDLFWLVMPSFHRVGLYVHWLDFVIPIGIGGFWVAFFIWQLQRKPLLPLNDPYFQEVPVHHHG
jgi:hypothetical protein